MQNRFLTTKEVIEITTFSRATIWRLEKIGRFPVRMRRKIGIAKVGWIESEIQGWIADRPGALKVNSQNSFKNLPTGF